MNQQQLLQKPELRQGKVGILHCLTSFNACHSHSNVGRWGSGGRKQNQ